MWTKNQKPLAFVATSGRELTTALRNALSSTAAITTATSPPAFSMPSRISSLESSTTTSRSPQKRLNRRSSAPLPRTVLLCLREVGLAQAGYGTLQECR